MKTIAAVLVGMLVAAWPAIDSNEVDLVSLDMGGHVESVTSEGGETIGARRLIDGNPRTYWVSDTEVNYPVEIVFSFFGRQPALVQAVVFEPSAFASSRVKDFEVWTSDESAKGRFTKLATFSAAPNGVQSFRIPPVETRFLKLSILSNHGDRRTVSIAKVKVIEGARAGYRPMLARNPDLAALVAGRVPESWPSASRQPAVQRAAASADAGPDTCGGPPKPTSAATAERPRHPESSTVLVLVADPRDYPPLYYSVRNDPNLANGLYPRGKLMAFRPSDARPAVLGDAEGIDTVVLSQVCDVQNQVPPAFEQALSAWVAAGHKLIIQDSDLCGGKHSVSPDYGFLPYKFATSSPGALGAKSSMLALLEESDLAHGNPSHPAFIDIEKWRNGPNDLGDSNTISQWDAHWCGVLVGTNALGVNGFEEAYAHHGRGLIIYDGFDRDQVAIKEYRDLVIRELALPFDPDPLACSVRVRDFVIVTESRVKTQPLAAPRTYTYPLTLLSNQRYVGRVKLSLTASPNNPGISGAFQPDVVDLSGKATSTLVVTTAANAGRGALMLSVRGTDTAGKTATLCLGLNERKTGGLKIATALTAPKNSGKNLEIILDESGSMKLPLGRSTRIDTARKVLEAVLAKVSDDFNVGLRLYGHRFASSQKQTCTDSELVMPVQRLNRARLQSIVANTRPRGETPLVYSVLQTITDLKAVGGGSVVLITDGEESCHGDPAAAVRELRSSGLDVNVNIVGFAMSEKQGQQALSTLASGTGGRFYSARNGEALGRVLLAAALRQYPYQVFDASGKRIAAGDAGGEAMELPPGLYKVVVMAADEQVVANPVTIPPGGDTTLTLALKDGHFVLLRQ